MLSIIALFINVIIYAYAYSSRERFCPHVTMFRTMMFIDTLNSIGYLLDAFTTLINSRYFIWKGALHVHEEIFRFLDEVKVLYHSFTGCSSKMTILRFFIFHQNNPIEDFSMREINCANCRILKTLDWLRISLFSLQYTHLFFE